MNNPFQMMRAMQNPAGFMRDMMMNSQAMQDPRAKRVCEMYEKHDSQGLQQMATNICKEYGTTPEEVMQRLQIPRA